MTNCSCAYIHTNCFIESGANHDRLLNNKQQTLELEAWKWGFIISDNSYPPLRSFHEPCTMQTANGRRQFRNWVKKLNIGHFAAWICMTVNSFTANHCVVQPVKLKLHYWYSNNNRYSTIINTDKIIPIFSASCCNMNIFDFIFSNNLGHSLMNGYHFVAPLTLYLVFYFEFAVRSYCPRIQLSLLIL